MIDSLCVRACREYKYILNTVYVDAVLLALVRVLGGWMRVC